MTKKLSDCVSEFKSEINQIESLFLSGENPTKVLAFQVPYSPLIDGCIVSLWDAWNRYIRSLFLASCSGEVVGLSGTRYKPQKPLSEATALSILKKESKKKGSSFRTIDGEPSWYKVQSLADIGNALGITNNNVILASISSSSVEIESGQSIPNPLEEIRNIRNFIAHKNSNTLSRAQKYMTPGTIEVSIHCHQKTFGGIARFSSWVDTMDSIAEAAAE
ncbi:hypothetical protein [Nocardiopsis dassonvillei]|uniref:hypothetical protein n=1 Tax=Nocardiopsis dassonvillei TaxID=2014 RepID=UPI000F824BB2|nr:hypothetical protein [Nocardiopsis dassonvillei]NKY77927.1 hypothetical protein [Nocardiopsis dassonvillei]